MSVSDDVIIKAQAATILLLRTQLAASEATKTRLLSALIEARRFVRAYCGENSVELEQIEAVIKAAK